MSHLATPRYLRRYHPPLVLPTWAELVSALAALPVSLYMFCLLPFPLFTLDVILLDTAAGLPTPVLAGGVTVVIAIVGWLLNRTISGFDASTKETKEAVTALTLLVTEMRLERKDDRQLVAYLKERQDKLETENTSLRTSVNAFDRHLAVQQATLGKPSTP